MIDYFTCQSRFIVFQWETVNRHCQCGLSEFIFSLLVINLLKVKANCQIDFKFIYTNDGNKLAEHLEQTFTYCSCRNNDILAAHSLEHYESWRRPYLKN